MLFVLLTILSSLSISLLLKLNETRNGDRLVVAGSNYIAAALLGWLFSDGSLSLPLLWIGAGLVTGAGFVGGFLLLMRSIRQAGLAVPISIARIATLGPVLLSVVVYGERPGPMEIAGVVIGLIAFVTLGLAQRRKDGSLQVASSSLDGGAFLLLTTLFLVMVFNDFAMKVVQVNGIDGGTFLLFLFGTAAAICWMGILGRNRKERNRVRERIRRQDILLGLLLGVPNYFSSYFLIHALRSLPASVVFPIVSAAGVLLASLAAVIIWRERPSLPAWIGILLAAVAVAMLG